MIRLILRYLRGPARLFAMAAPLLMFVEVFMDLQQPSLMARIIDIGVAQSDRAYVLSEGILMVLAAAIGFVGGSLCSIFAAKASVSMGGAMRLGLFTKTLELSEADVDRLKTSSLVTRCTNDVMQLQNMLMMLLRGMVRTPLLLVGSVLMAVMLSPSLSLVFCFAIPVVLGSIALVLWRSSSLFSKAQNCLDQVTTIMRESVLGIRTVKAFSLEPSQAGRFREANGNLTETSISAQQVNFAMMPLVTLAMNLCVVAVLWFGGHMVKHGDLEVGKIMAFINYLVQISGSVMMAANLVINVSRAMASATRIGEVLKTDPALDCPSIPRSTEGFTLEFRNVDFAYEKGREPALSGISFQVEEGMHVGIIGATGSGKSTLAALVPRLYDATAGQVLVGGIDVRDWDARELRRRVGLVTQESQLFAGSIEKNLRFGGSDRMQEALSIAQAADFVQALPEGIGSEVAQRGRNFSGGQRQRLSIARALSLNPKLLILDDSSSALDLATEARLRLALGQRRRGLSTITIAQRISAIMGCDLILVLEFGRIVSMGKHRQLLASSEIYRSIVSSQLGEEALDHA